MTNGEQSRYPNVASSRSLSYHAPMTIISRHIIYDMDNLEVFKLCSYSGDIIITDAKLMEFYLDGAGLTNAQIIEVEAKDGSGGMVVGVAAINGKPFQLAQLDETEESWIIENLAFLKEEEHCKDGKAETTGKAETIKTNEQLAPDDKALIDEANNQIIFMRQVIGKESCKCLPVKAWRLMKPWVMTWITRGMMDQYEIADAIYGEVVPSVLSVPVYEGMRRVCEVPAMTAFFTTTDPDGIEVAIEAPVAVYAMETLSQNAIGNFTYQIWRLAYQVLIGGTPEENKELLDDMGGEKLVLQCEIRFEPGKKEKVDKILAEKCQKYGRLATKLVCNAGNIARTNEVDRDAYRTTKDTALNLVRKFKVGADTLGVNKGTEIIVIR